jgi:transcriptional regulator with XRE-family HTH domain
MSDQIEKKKYLRRTPTIAIDKVLTIRVDLTIGEVIQVARKRMGLSMEELAIKSGVSTRTLHAMTKNSSSVRMNAVESVLNSLGISMNVSISGSDEEIDA